MPAASQLQPRDGVVDWPLQPSAVLESQSELQTPSSTLRQHLDADALPRPDYFDSVDELHLWYQMQYGDTLRDNLELCSKHVEPSKAASAASNDHHRPRPKLAVCHDFKGGYSDNPHQRGYTLEHFHLIDTLIYFSHKRVSIPPVSWLSSASRTGTKVLGTLIFEWEESIPDISKLLRGPERKTMPLRGEPCFSPQYAIELIELALARGFSGFLVNIEVNLDLGFSCSGEPWPAWVGQQARIGEMRRNAERLRGWLHFLREEGARRFIEAGKPVDEWEVMWYDSVVYPYGQLAWQDALNQYNVDYFRSAHTFFTNYTWARPPQPLPPGQLIDPKDESHQTQQLRGFGLTGSSDGGFHSHLLMSGAMADSVDRLRTDVYVGIDVFGRNCWGGLKAWKSLDMIGPHRSQKDNEKLGLSVALFAPGWTWEEENAGLTLEPERKAQKRSWSDWWHVDEAFWIGAPCFLTSTSYRITVARDNIKPLQSYFGHSYLETARLLRRASPLGFYTNFNIGSGTKWFDRGELVYDWSERTNHREREEAGFTDMAVSMPKADLLYAKWHNQRLHSDAQETSERSGYLPRSWSTVVTELDDKENIVQTPWHVLSCTFDQERVWAGSSSFVVSLLLDSTSTCSNEVMVELCSAVITDSQGGELSPTDWTFTIVYDATGMEELEILPRVGFTAEMKPETAQLNTEYDYLGHGWKAASCRLRFSYLPSKEALILGFEARNKMKRQIQLRIGALQLLPVTAPATSCHSSRLEVMQAADSYDASMSDTKIRWLRASVLSWTAPNQASATMYYNVWVQAIDSPDTRIWLGTSTREASSTEFCLPFDLALPPHLSDANQEGFEFVITSLDIILPVEVAKGPATIVYTDTPLFIYAHALQ
ncbi:related to Endo-b-N-acetylglucosaminidase [Melanopsichium pennsylvanicum]|uniref:Related to Endo-b-N-acetylglucosaminidase n=2 Tax=Melanopsichium pennsylvanicum TaxID=63383 RepID=A0AAJ5C3Y2_9BASI|nr:related to Endo-b-N-acetylglucosaminidase [Melanopsichium pennsylvanicum 4]SNX83101.1 related to Endo-b-N-acetylglucosaminidase [Melanopsichium pennsylvanicum]